MKRIIAAITIFVMLFSLIPSSDAVVSDKAEPLPDGSVPCIKGTNMRGGVKTAEHEQQQRRTAVRVRRVCRVQIRRQKSGMHQPAILPLCRGNEMQIRIGRGRKHAEQPHGSHRIRFGSI